MVETKFYPPTNDVIFHCLFGTKGQEKITKAFLEGLLKKEIKELDLDRKLEFIREYYNNKEEIADVRATDSNKNSYILEMQNKTNKFLPKRFLSYACKAYIAELKTSEEYNNLRKVAIIIIMTELFPQIQSIEKYHTVWNFREKNNHENILTDDIEIHIIEIPKYLKQKENGGPIEPWLEFIVNPKGKEAQEAMKKYKSIKEAAEELNRLNSNDDVRELADAKLFANLDRNSEIGEARREGIAEGIEKGIEQGIDKEKIDIAKKMLKLNLDIHIIMDSTGLTKEEIELLK